MNTIVLTHFTHCILVYTGYTGSVGTTNKLPHKHNNHDSSMAVSNLDQSIKRLYKLMCYCHMSLYVTRVNAVTSCGINTLYILPHRILCMPGADCGSKDYRDGHAPVLMYHTLAQLQVYKPNAL